MKRAAACLLLLLAVGCSDPKPQPCTNDCGGYHRNAALAQKVAKDSGLPICDQASIFQTSSPSLENGTDMPEYAVQIVMDGYCPASSEERIRSLLNKDGNTAFVTNSGHHVRVSAVPYSKYAISIWRTSIKNAR